MDTTIKMGFAEGTTITLIDGTKKFIQDIQVGNQLLGLNGISSTVISSFKLQPDDQFAIQKLDNLTFYGGALFVVKPKDGGYDYPTLGTHNANAYIWSKRAGTLNNEKWMGITKIDPYFISDDCAYATEDITDYKRVSVINNDNLTFYNFVLTDTQTFIANGFYVTGAFYETESELNILYSNFWE